jgi:hypothetical protein
MILYAYPMQQFNSPGFTPEPKALHPRAFIGPARNRLHQLTPDTFRGVETGLRLLKNHRYVMPDQLTPLAGGEAQQVNVIKDHAVCGNAPVVVSHAANRLGHQALARTGLPDQTANFAFAKRQINAIDCFNRPVRGHKFNCQITNIQ